MSTEDLTLDGNGIAGLLAEVFATDVTTADRGCQSCGEVNPVGAHRAYRGAGVVLRCPACGDVALRAVLVADGYVVCLTGTWTVTVPTG